MEDLRAWNELGLVRTEVDSYGLPYYNTADFTKVYILLARQRLQMPPAEIAGQHRPSDLPVRAVMEAHLASVEAEIDENRCIVDRLRQALGGN